VPIMENLPIVLPMVSKRGMLRRVTHCANGC